MGPEVASPMMPERVKALVIEDDPFWTRWFSSNLEAVDNGAEVRVTDSVAGAREMLRSDDQYDVIVCDHFLNGEEKGLDLWRSLRRQKSTIPFVLTSGMGRAEFFKESSSDTVHPLFVDKNCSPEEFQRLIGCMLAPDRSHNLVDAKTTPEQAIREPATTTMTAPALRAEDAILQEIVDCFW